MTIGAAPKSGDVCDIPCFDCRKVEGLRSMLAEEEAKLPQLVGLYKLLGNGTRLKIILALGEGELCVCDVAHVLGLSVAATSHQLKLLGGQGWLRMRNDGKMVFYWLDSERLLKALRGDLAMLADRLG